MQLNIDYSNIPYGPLPIEWRPVIGYEKMYEVSNYCEVKSLKRKIFYTNKQNGLTKQIIRVRNERIISNTKNSCGYWNAKLCKKNILYCTTAHRVAAIAFIPKIDGKGFINHKNSIRSDRMLGNLEWCTASENSQHMWDNSNSSQARKESLSKRRARLTKKEYNHILEMINTGMYQCEIAKLTGVSKQLISLIKLGKSGYTSNFLNY